MAERKTDPLVDALLGLLSEYAYRDVTLAMVAERAGITLAALRHEVDGKFALLTRFAGSIDEAVLAGLDGELQEEATHERLFDVLMRRFDALAPHREAIRSLRDAAREDPGFALSLWRLTTRSQRWMLAGADVPLDGARGAIVARGLALSYARLMDTWLEDEDPGLARTMAALDKALRRGARAIGMIDTLHRLAAPLRVLIGRAMEQRRRRKEHASDRNDDNASAPTRH